MRFKLCAAAILLGLPLAACAPPTLYDWGGYDQALYEFHREPAEQVAFMKVLREVIDKNESVGKKVPPGIYAEYGYQALSIGKTREAIVFFEKESDAWPEARQFMEVMIKYASNGGRVERTATPSAASGKSGG